MNGYNLSRAWFNFRFENPEKCTAAQTEMYLYIVDLWNRLGQKEKIGLPTGLTMQTLGIGSYNTYKKTLEALIKFGFIKLVADSKNQYQSKVIALSYIDKPIDKPLDKATAKARDEASDKAPDTIYKQPNKGTTKQGNKGVPPFNFKNSLISLGVEKEVASDFMAVRKAKDGVNTQIAFNAIEREIEKSKLSANDCIKMAVENSWKGFKAQWAENQDNKQTAPETGRKLDWIE